MRLNRAELRALVDALDAIEEVAASSGHHLVTSYGSTYIALPGGGEVEVWHESPDGLVVEVEGFGR